MDFHVYCVCVWVCAKNILRQSYIYIWFVLLLNYKARKICVFYVSSFPLFYVSRIVDQCESKFFFPFVFHKLFKSNKNQRWFLDAFDLKSLSTQSIFWSAAHSLTSIDSIGGSVGCFGPNKYCGQLFDRFLCAASLPAKDAKSLCSVQQTKNISAEHHYYRANSIQ